MREALVTTNPVTLSFARHLLAENGIVHFVFDAQLSAVEGSIGAFPRRLMVADEDWHLARRLFDEQDLL